MKLLALLGLDRRLRRARIAAGEGALAAEDRVQLLRLAWADEKHRIKLLLAMAMAVLGLTTVVVALLSVAVVVHFWETPHRVAAAWSVAALWLVLWAVAVVKLIAALRSATDGLEAAQREFARDWRWLRRRIGKDGATAVAPPTRPATREELLARIARQRERIALLKPETAQRAQAGPAPARFTAPPPDESASDTALRLARAHPVAAGALAAGALAMIGPARAVRWAAWLLPVLWRMR